MKDRQAFIVVYGRTIRGRPGSTMLAGTPVLIAVDAHCIRRLLDLPRLDADSFADSGQDRSSVCSKV
jgi:hypothetical protein